MVRFENVTVRYGEGPFILGNASFEFPAGSFHFVTGGSGAGKSTLLRLIQLAIKPVQGRIWLFEQETSRLRRRDLVLLRRNIGMVYQDFRLIEHQSAHDNVALPLRIAGTREALVREHVPELLAWVGLAGRMDALPETLSGGEQQRVAIARAVINRPRLLLADEPTGNVDDEVAVRLLYLFEELNKLGTTVVVATHDEGLVERFQYPRLHIRDGQVSAVPNRLAERPAPHRPRQPGGQPGKQPGSQTGRRVAPTVAGGRH